MPSVSVILPVYNGEKYLNNTMNSILGQSYSDFELIVIDDGSEDRSLEIVTSFAEKDNRVLVVSQKNSGICKARNKGIQVAQSRYIMFCDHDDIYNPGFIEKAFQDINSGNYEFVKYGCREIYMNDDCIYKQNECVLEEKEYFQNVRKLPLAYCEYNEYIWDGIYSKDLLVKIGGFNPSFKAGCEDIDIMLRMIQVASSCKTSHLIFYDHYIRSSTSTSRKYSENTYLAVLKMFDKRLKVLKTDSNKFEKYRNAKASQLIWALMGMFSFPNCDLNIKKMASRLKAIKHNNYLGKWISPVNQPLKIKLSVYCYNFGFCYLISAACFIKRNCCEKKAISIVR